MGGREEGASVGVGLHQGERLTFVIQCKKCMAL